MSYFVANHAGSINPASDSSQSIDDKLSEIFKDLEHISAVTEGEILFTVKL